LTGTICDDNITLMATFGDRTEDLEPVWKALSNATRRRILDLLSEQPRTTGALAAAFPELSRFAVMQHLRVLEEADLVVPRRSGRERYNYINAVPIERIHDRWIARHVRPWTEALVSLRHALEAEAREEAG